METIEKVQKRDSRIDAFYTSYKGWKLCTSYSVLGHEYSTFYTSYKGWKLG